MGQRRAKAGKGGPANLLTTCGDTGAVGPLRPDLAQTCASLGTLFDEVVRKFRTRIFHAGGDEVHFGCWQSNPEEYKKKTKKSTWPSSQRPRTILVDWSGYVKGGKADSIGLLSVVLGGEYEGGVGGCAWVRGPVGWIVLVAQKQQSAKVYG